MFLRLGSDGFMSDASENVLEIWVVGIDDNHTLLKVCMKRLNLGENHYWLRSGGAIVTALMKYPPLTLADPS